MDSKTLERIKKYMQGNRFDDRADKALTVISLTEGLELVAEIERLKAIETKWTELLPNLEVLRHYLFRVDHKLSSLDEAGMIKEPEQVIDYTSAFLSVLEFYFPSTEEEEMAANELTRLERLGLELSQAGGELREEVKREFASLKAQIETEMTRLEAEVKRLQADSRALDNLRAAAQPVIEAAKQDVAVGLGRYITELDIYEIGLTGEQIEALRMALDNDPSPVSRSQTNEVSK